MEATVMDCLVVLAAITVGLGYALHEERRNRTTIARMRRLEAERIRRAEDTETWR